MSLLADKKPELVPKGLSAKKSLSLFELFAAALIALVAFGLRLSFIGFPTARNPDEPLVATLAENAAERGQFTANWAGAMQGTIHHSASFYWNRPTYQFSPYTLLEEGLHWALYHATGWPGTPDQHIYCARAVSCAWGALGVFFTFLATWKAFASLPTAFLAEGILALTPLNIEDSMFARVDAFVCFLVIVCFYFVALAMKKSGTLFWTTTQRRTPAPWRPGPWGVAASLVAGIAIAAKYNVAPILMLVLWIPLAGWWLGAIRGRAACVQSLAVVVIAAAGFVIATPELIINPQPLVDGMRFELGHYREGHIPFQALGWRDNNLFYWTWYLSRLGFGLLPFLAVGLFFLNLNKSSSLTSLVLASYLIVAGILTVLPRVRFERNCEVILGPLSIAAALGFISFHGQLVSRHRQPLALTVICLIIFFAQQVRTILDIRELLRPESRITRVLEVGRWNPATCYYGDMMSLFNPKACDFANVFLADYNDSFSASNRQRWFDRLGVEHATHVYHSTWSKHGYPFSSLDVVFGPARLYHIHRKISGNQSRLGGQS
jgi:hypothetical protein